MGQHFFDLVPNLWLVTHDDLRFQWEVWRLVLNEFKTRGRVYGIGRSHYMQFIWLPCWGDPSSFVPYSLNSFARMTNLGEYGSYTPCKPGDGVLLLHTVQCPCEAWLREIPPTIVILNGADRMGGAVKNLPDEGKISPKKML